MSPVSSVNFDPALKVSVRVHKGDRLGNFLFGGSDFVMVFQAGYSFTRIHRGIRPDKAGRTG